MTEARHLAEPEVALRRLVGVVTIGAEQPCPGVLARAPGEMAVVAYGVAGETVAVRGVADVLPLLALGVEASAAVAALAAGVVRGDLLVAQHLVVADETLFTADRRSTGDHRDPTGPARPPLEGRTGDEHGHDGAQGEPPTPPAPVRSSRSEPPAQHAGETTRSRRRKWGLRPARGGAVNRAEPEAPSLLTPR